MAVVVDAQTEGLRQLERAERLLEVGTGPRRGSEAPETQLNLELPGTHT